MGVWLGCKRRSRIPKYIKAEKTEVGVVVREDRGKPILCIPLQPIARLIAEATEKGVDVKEIFRDHRMGITPN